MPYGGVCLMRSMPHEGFGCTAISLEARPAHSLKREVEIYGQRGQSSMYNHWSLFNIMFSKGMALENNAVDRWGKQNF